MTGVQAALDKDPYGEPFSAYGVSPLEIGRGRESGSSKSQKQDPYGGNRFLSTVFRLLIFRPWTTAQMREFQEPKARPPTGGNRFLSTVFRLLIFRPWTTAFSFHSKCLSYLLDTPFTDT